MEGVSFFIFLVIILIVLIAFALLFFFMYKSYKRKINKILKGEMEGTKTRSLDSKLYILTLCALLVSFIGFIAYMGIKPVFETKFEVPFYEDIREFEPIEYYNRLKEKSNSQSEIYWGLIFEIHTDNDGKVTGVRNTIFMKRGINAYRYAASYNNSTNCVEYRRAIKLDGKLEGYAFKDFLREINVIDFDNVDYYLDRPHNKPVNIQYNFNVVKGIPVGINEETINKNGERIPILRNNDEAVLIFSILGNKFEFSNGYFFEWR